MNLPLRAVLVLLALLPAALRAEEPPPKVVIYPIDRATILAGSKFDFKVEFPAVIEAAAAKVTINGGAPELILGKAPEFVDAESYTPPPSDEALEDPPEPELKEGEKDPRDRPASAMLLRDCVVNAPGRYTVAASDGKISASVTWDVYATARKRVAKNVILMIGDGMTPAHRTAARILSKGIQEGKYNGKLAMDSFPHTALLGTSGVDSVVTDSANSAHAYTTGHKSSNAALGVYADRTRSAFDDPKVEPLPSLARRISAPLAGGAAGGMAAGIVTTSELQDATPAAMYAHCRSRSKKAEITEMLYDSGVEVALGGGLAFFPPKGARGSYRADQKDFVAKFRESGYALANTAPELAVAADANTKKMLGLFNTGNMDSVLDRKFLRKGTVSRFPQQPDLVEMTKAALEVLARNENGFVLLVESALIDKFTHALDWERAVMETIMFDQAIAVVREFARRGDTLVLVTSDHGHCINIAGTVDDARHVASLQEKVRIGTDAGYPKYADADGDGYPDSLDVSKRLVVLFGGHPPYYETYRPKLDGPFRPVMITRGPPMAFVANEKYKDGNGDDPPALLRDGNLPRNQGSAPHAADDVVLFAEGPGSEAVKGFMDNTEVFRVIAEALGLGK